MFVIQAIVFLSTIYIVRYTRKPKMKSKYTQTEHVRVCGRGTQTESEQDVMSIEDETFELDELFFALDDSLANLTSVRFDKVSPRPIKWAWVN